jgi:hypothetical protein
MAAEPLPETDISALETEQSTTTNTSTRCSKNSERFVLFTLKTFLSIEVSDQLMMMASQKLTNCGVAAIA